jgi:hypothetical protein
MSAYPATTVIKKRNAATGEGGGVLCAGKTACGPRPSRARSCSFLLRPEYLDHDANVAPSLDGNGERSLRKGEGKSEPMGAALNSF